MITICTLNRELELELLNNGKMYLFIFQDNNFKKDCGGAIHKASEQLLIPTSTIQTQNEADIPNVKISGIN